MKSIQKFLEKHPKIENRSIKNISLWPFWRIAVKQGFDLCVTKWLIDCVHKSLQI